MIDIVDSNVLNFPSIKKDDCSGGASNRAFENFDQLSLPLEANFSMIIVREKYLKEFNELSDLVAKFEPRFFIDFRISPRLDIFGTTRTSAFSFFKRNSLRYIDILGRLNIKGASDISSFHEKIYEALGALLSNSREGGSYPVILFFDSPEILASVQKNLLTELVPMVNFHHGHQASLAKSL